MQSVWPRLADPAAVCLIGTLAACAAYVWLVLTDRGQALSFIGQTLETMAEKGGWRRSLAKPLGACGFCFAFWFGFATAAANGLWWVDAAFAACVSAVVYSIIDKLVNAY